ncbi:MAG: gliding motility-associated C-terminal domain-containing protein [Bacteroidota bacterium]
MIQDIEVNKQGDLNIETPRVLVSGMLDVTNGVIQAEEIDDLVVTGESDNTGQGYVEGSLIGISTGRPVTFPMGVNGFANYITFSSADPDIVFQVECVQPDPTTLLPTEDMVGIAGQVEWRVSTIEDSTNVEVTVDFSGLDFVNFSNGAAINSNLYEPAIVVFTENDTIFQALTSVAATPQNGASTQTSGRIESTDAIRISTTPTRIAVAWIPLVSGPQFFIPNTFSPNATYEENRFFRPFFSGGSLTSINITVYNTYNEPVYTYTQSGADLDLTLAGWDGRLNTGSNAEEGVYYYSIQLIADAQMYRKSGSVLLLNQ